MRWSIWPPSSPPCLPPLVHTQTLLHRSGVPKWCAALCWGWQATTFRCEDRLAQLLAVMPGRWHPDWSLRVWGPQAELRAQFPPSYVLAGSASVELENAVCRSSWRYNSNGYQAEWLHLADVAEGRCELHFGVQTIVEDLLYALALADGAGALILGKG